MERNEPVYKGMVKTFVLVAMGGGQSAGRSITTQRVVHSFTKLKNSARE